MLLCAVTFTSNGSLGGCPLFHPTLAYSAAVNVHRMGMMKCISFALHFDA